VTLSAAALALSTPLCSEQGGSSWLDAPHLEPWNKPGMAIPSAPQGEKNPDPRCRALARSPGSDEDRQLRARGWDLIGPPTEGWQIRVIGGSADYDGMCRPRQFQHFVFVRGSFAGTLSPRTMDSRTDGALGRVHIESDHRLAVVYSRYNGADPLCCPSRTTTVSFDIEKDPTVVRPVSASTASNR
jgi:LppP/LprE lipoprotein